MACEEHQALASQGISLDSIERLRLSGFICGRGRRKPPSFVYCIVLHYIVLHGITIHYNSRNVTHGLVLHNDTGYNRM